MKNYTVSRQIRDEACSVKIARWKNGLRCLHLRPKNGNFVIQLYLLNGSEHYPYGWSGIPHLCEHVATTNVLGISQREFARKMDRIGDTFFETGSESVFFGCETDRRRWKHSIRFFHDTLQACRHGKIDESSLESQKKVIRHEIASDESLLDRATRAFNYHLWPHSSGGQSSLGTVRQLKKFNSAHVIDYFQETVVGKRLVLGISGPINSREVFDYVGSLFGKLPEGEESPEILPVKVNGTGIVLKPYEGEKKTVFIIGQQPRKKRGPRGKYCDTRVKQVLAKILGGLHSSEPYISASVNGQSYEIEVECGSSCLKFFGGVDTKDIDDVIENCLRYLFSIARFGPERIIFDRAKSALLLDEAYFALRPRSRLHYATSDLIDEDNYSTYQAARRAIAQIRPEHVQDYVQRVVSWKNFTLLVAGKINGYQPRAKVKRWCGLA